MDSSASPMRMGAKCDLTEVLETRQLLNTLCINIGVWVVLLGVFEVNRHMKSIYLKRSMKETFIRAGRVPPPPSTGILGWLSSLRSVSEDDILTMVGLDAYMLMRYINICFRITLFISLWGVLVLAPYYASSGGGHCSWNRYTLSNVPQRAYTDAAADVDRLDGVEGSNGNYGGNGNNGLSSLDNGEEVVAAAAAGGGIQGGDQWSKLWLPAVFAYVFSGYYCMVMYSEYHNFLGKRVAYLREGDPDTPPQAYYTVMVEKIPPALRTAQELAAFFDNLFPGEVYSIQLAFDLHDLEAQVKERHNVRNALEGAIAKWEASGRTERPSLWLADEEANDGLGYDHSTGSGTGSGSAGNSDLYATAHAAAAAAAIAHDNNNNHNNINSNAGFVRVVNADQWDRVGEMLGFNLVDAIDYYSKLLQQVRVYICTHACVCVCVCVCPSLTNHCANSPPAPCPIYYHYHS